jgi:hypothetical protein
LRWRATPRRIGTVRDLRGDEIVAGYKAAAEEQGEIAVGFQQQRQALRLEWAKIQAYNSECEQMATNEEMQRRLASIVAELEEVEKKLSYHQSLAMALARRATCLESEWAQPVAPTRLAARRVV